MYLCIDYYRKLRSIYTPLISDIQLHTFCLCKPYPRHIDRCYYRFGYIFLPCTPHLASNQLLMTYTLEHRGHCCKGRLVHIPEPFCIFVMAFHIDVGDLLTNPVGKNRMLGGFEPNILRSRHSSLWYKDLEAKKIVRCK